jgi:bacterioferritin-associated ferredoxin
MLSEVAMIVCHCRAITDRAIRAAVRDGFDNAQAVTEQTGAGSCCGGCLPGVDAVVRAELGDAASSGTQSRAYRPLRVA